VPRRPFLWNALELKKKKKKKKRKKRKKKRKEKKTERLCIWELIFNPTLIFPQSDCPLPQ
jgi:hypothetical protein